MSERLLTVWKVTRHEFRLGWRNPGFWAMFALCTLVAALMCSTRGMSASQAGYLLGRLSGRLLGLLGLFWMANVASRDAWLRAQDLVLAKPQNTEVLVLGRFLGNYALLLSIWLGMLGAGALLQATWGGTPLILCAYGDALLCALLPLAYLSILGYAFSLLFNTPVAAGVVALYWVLVLSGRDYVARIFNFTLSQHIWINVFLTVAVLALTMLLYQSGRRAAPRWPRSLVWTSTACFLLGLGLAVTRVWASHDPPLHRAPVMVSIAAQQGQVGSQMPGFWLPDQHGRIQGLHGVYAPSPSAQKDLPVYEEHIRIVLLWSPLDSTSTEALRQLQQLRQELPPEEVVILAICISEDHAVARHFARENRISFPMLTDPGARFTNPPEAGSPIAEAFRAEELPTIYVADRDRIIRHTASFTDQVNLESLRIVLQRLRQT